MAFLKSFVTLKLEGVEHLKKGEFKKALDRFNRANKKKPENVEILSYLSQAQLGLGDVDGALESIEQAISLEPSNVVHLQLKATYLMRKQEFGEAVEIIDRCIEMRPGDVAYLMRGQVDFNEKRYEAAETWFDKALELDPENPLSNQMKGLVLFYKRQFTEAIPFLEKSLAVGESEAVRNLIEECKRQG